MPRTQSSIVIEEKNKLASASAWLLALEITIPGLSAPVRVVQNDEDITWRGETWVAMPFDLGDVADEKTGECPQVEVRVANVNRVVESYLHEWDAYCKTNGYETISFTLFLLNSADLANTDAAVEHSWRLDQPAADNEWVTFRLGGDDLTRVRFPRSRVLKNVCRYKTFKGSRCGYSGTATSCDRTLTTCRALDNSARFGGAPGVGGGGFKIA